MRSHELRLEQYDTDKIVNRYLEQYDPILEPWVERDVTLLEVGVATGGSVRMWRDYFPRGSIVGIDRKLPPFFGTEERIRLFEGDQADPSFLSHVAMETAPEGFDIVIDDASHIGELTKRTFWHLFDRHLKPGGVYAIEDWGTGYWDDWPDGKTFNPKRLIPSQMWSELVLRSRAARRMPVKLSAPSHEYGMVGFIKGLVDEQGAADLTRQRRTGRPTRRSKFGSLLITPSVVFVRKALDECASRLLEL